MLHSSPIKTLPSLGLRNFLLALLVVFYLVPLRSLASDDCVRLMGSGSFAFAPENLSGNWEAFKRREKALEDAGSLLPKSEEMFIETIAWADPIDLSPGQINIDRTLYFEERITAFIDWVNGNSNVEAGSPELLIILLERSSLLLSRISEGSDYWNLGIKARPWLRQSLRLAVVRILDQLWIQTRELVRVRAYLDQYLDHLYMGTDQDSEDSFGGDPKSEAIRAVESVLEWRGTRARVPEAASLAPNVVPFSLRPRK